MVKLVRKNRAGDNPIELKNKGEVFFFQFPVLEQIGVVEHGFSTKLGGVSRGVYKSMNLGTGRGDEAEAVKENYKRMAKALNMSWEKMVLSDQTHTTNIRVVTKQDAGKGLAKERDYENIDGLVTNVPGIPLVTFFADCVPLFFADPVHKAIGLSHSGWRGTAERMGKHTVEVMNREYGSNPKDIFACIGPSICGDCYEVGAEVAEQFAAAFLPEQKKEILVKKADGKYLLNLWKANELIMYESGIRPDHLTVTDICTQCNPDLLYSHRVMGEKRGNLAAFLSLK